MGFLDRLLGRTPQTPTGYGPPQGGYPAPPTGYGAPQQAPQQPPYGAPSAPPGSPQDAPAGASQDEVAIARYRYLLRTAPPEKIEEAHAEAFAQLSPQQRQQVLGQLSQGLPENERPRSDDPRDLARSATRAELRQPGFLQRSFGGAGGMGGGMGMGGAIMGSMLGTVAGVVVGTAVADALFGGFDASPEAADAGVGDQSDQGGDPGDAGDQGSDVGDQGDQGGDLGDFGSDFGGGYFGDTGGGDFGGGDFGDFGGDF